MRSFKDCEGREWALAVRTSSLERVKSATGVYLLDQPALAAAVAADHLKLADILYALCRPDVDARGLTREQFIDGLAGDAAEAAVEALQQEIVDFFPSSRREIQRMALEKSRAAEREILKRATAKVEAIDPAAIADALEATTSSSKSTDLPTSSPAPSA